MNQVWIAENREKNGKGYKLMILNIKGKNKDVEVWTKKILKKDVKQLRMIGIEVEERF